MSESRLDVQLAKDEVIHKKFQFSYSPLFFFLKSYFWMTNKRLIINHPNLFFLIPTGSDTATFPLRNIGGIRNKNKCNPLLAIGSALFLLATLGGLSSGDISSAFWYLLIAFFLALQAVQTFVAVSAGGGAAEKFSYVPWESNDAKKMIRELNQTIAEL